AMPPLPSARPEGRKAVCHSSTWRGRSFCKTIAPMCGRSKGERRRDEKAQANLRASAGKCRLHGGNSSVGKFFDRPIATRFRLRCRTAFRERPFAATGVCIWEKAETTTSQLRSNADRSDGKPGSSFACEDRNQAVASTREP